MKGNNIRYCLITENVVVVDRQTLFTMDSKAGGEANLTNIYRHFGISYPKFHKMDNLAKTGYLAAEILLGKGETDIPAPKTATGIYLFNKNSSFDTDQRFWETVADPNNSFPSPSLFVYTLPNIVIGEICIRFKIQGEGIIFESDSFDTKMLFEYLKNPFNSGLITDCLVGNVDFHNKIPSAFLAHIDKTTFETLDKETFHNFVANSNLGTFSVT